MLARLFQSARSIFNFGNSIIERDSDTPRTTYTPTMVTTRGQSGNKLALEVQSSLPVEDVSAGGLSKKRRRADLAVDGLSSHDWPNVTPTKKKQKKLVMRNKDEEHFESHSHIEVVIPVKDIVGENTKNPNPLGHERAKGKRGTASKSTHEIEDSEVNGKGLPETGNTAEETAQDITEEITEPKLSSAKSNERNYGKGANASPKQTERKDEQFGSTSVSQPAVSKHKRFGTEEPAAVEDVADMVTITQVTISEEDEDSDDDAPEVVEKQDAHERSRTASRVASKVAKEQNAKIRKKRKERDAKLKEQAESAKKKIEAADNEQAEADVIDEDQNRDTILKVKPAFSKSNLPEFLPAEYLEDNSVDLVSSLQPTSPGFSNGPKKTKFIEPVTKRPKDRAKDRVIYRVSEARGDALLAPKAVNNAKSIKERWLKGRTDRKGGVSVQGGVRKVPNAGFFVNRR